MEFLTPENIASLATPVGFIAYLIYLVSQQSKIIDKKDDLAQFWQNKAFDVSRESQKEIFEVTQAQERILRIVKGEQSV